MPPTRSPTLDWIGRHVLPHEKDVRAWLRVMLRGRGEPDDIVQEAYCRLSGLEDTASIVNPRAYFFRVVRNVLLEQMRRARVVRIETIAGMEQLELADDAPSPERVVVGQSELEKVKRLIARLPGRCRDVIELRKIHGLSQREAAQALGVREDVIEREVAKGMRLILQCMVEEGVDGGSTSGTKSHERGKQRREN